MNTFIEDIAAAFGWSKSDYAENHLLDYYRALVNSEKDKRMKPAWQSPKAT